MEEQRDGRLEDIEAEKKAVLEENRKLRNALDTSRKIIEDVYDENSDVISLNRKLHAELKRANRDFFILLIISFVMLAWIVFLIIR